MSANKNAFEEKNPFQTAQVYEWFLYALKWNHHEKNESVNDFFFFI